jgi:molecular chaperone IbpA
MVNYAALDPTRINTYSIGFDRMFDSLTSASGFTQQTNYPPYNIIKKSDTEFLIEVAVAGFSKKDVEVRMSENRLNISSIDLRTSEMDMDDTEYLHKGISARSFKRAFTLSDDVVVKEANMENGILSISMERVIPEDKKPRTIEIK